MSPSQRDLRASLARGRWVVASDNALVVVPPQVAIVGAGRIAPRIVAVDGQPVALLAQLRNGGRMIIPVGESGSESQELVLVEKSVAGTLSERSILPVAFVPLVGCRGHHGERTP